MDTSPDLVRLAGVTVVGERTCLIARRGDGRTTRIWVDCVPDFARAAAQTAGLRRLVAVRVAVRATGVTAQLFAIGSRHPMTRSIAVSAALALAADRVPVRLAIE